MKEGLSVDGKMVIK